MLFRSAYRKRLTLSDTLIYMGAHGAVCRGGLVPKRPASYHNRVKLVKGLPSVPPERTIATQDAADAEKAARRAKKSAKESQPSATPAAVSAIPVTLDVVPKTAKPQGLAGIFRR
jgi:hypothetical protein